MKQILVTGGAGFIGSHLCEALVERGDSVICVDNLSTGSRENVAHLLGCGRFEMILHDVNFPLYSVHLYFDIDKIYNLACPASPVQYQKDPVRTVKTSVNGAVNMLELAKRTGAKILQASTSEVYGNPTQHPQTESYHGSVNPIGPRACYDEGKRCAETLFFDYHRQHGTRIKVARIFNTYGPRMQPDDGRVVSSFVVQCLSGLPITVFGDGSHTRSFCYVSDTVRGLMALMDSQDDLTGPINIGNPCEITVAALAGIVSELVGGSSSVQFLPIPVDDPTRRCPDISLAIDQLCWLPTVPLEEGIERTILYFKEVMVAP
jgi:UDP-glucuronate decarboxylase